MLAAVNVLTQDPIQFGVNVAVLGILLLIIIIFRPFADWFKNIGMAVILIASVFSELCRLTSNEPYDNQPLATAFAYVNIGLLFVFVLGSIGLFLYYQVFMRMRRRRMALLDAQRVTKHAAKVLS